MVNGEQVRVAGANVGTIESVDVSMPGETVAYRDGKPVAVPGKAIIVMNITDPGFQDFRSDASCQIRPQSLIGEKFVDCRPDPAPGPGLAAAAAAEEDPRRARPAPGEYLLPLGSSGTSVDPDLINDIQTLPYAQRFRLIFNELGAGLAGRGDDLEVLIKRANPVLRDVDRLFGDPLRPARPPRPAGQRLGRRSCGRWRASATHVAGFFTNAGAAAQASSERGAQLEASLRKFPTFLREFRLTMRSLQGFSDAAAPVFSDLGKAAPGAHRRDPDADAVLGSDDGRPEEPRRDRRNGRRRSSAKPTRSSARRRDAGQEPATRRPTELAKLLTNIKQTGGWDSLVEADLQHRPPRSTASTSTATSAAPWSR